MGARSLGEDREVKVKCLGMEKISTFRALVSSNRKEPAPWATVYPTVYLQRFLYKNVGFCRCFTCGGSN